MNIFLLLLLTLTQVYAAPAYNKTRTFTQSDGSTFEAKAYGNQHLNWLETTDGEILKYNQTNKNFDYAIITNKQLKASGTRYKKQNSLRTRAAGYTSKVDKKEVYKLWGQKQTESNKKIKHSH